MPVGMPTWGARRATSTLALLAVAGLLIVATAALVVNHFRSSTDDGPILQRRPAVAAKPTDCRSEGKAEQLSKDLGPLTGSGPVRVVGDPWDFSLAPPSNFDSDRWGGNKLLIAVHRSVGDHVLVRGKAVGAVGERVGFGTRPEPEFSRDRRLDGRRELDGGWVDFPNMIRLEKPGCYLLQFDFAGGTTRLALRATPWK